MTTAHPSPARWAIYFAPPAGSALDILAAAWLGRDLDGHPVARPRFDSLPQARLAEITAEPARYGFHATLKPPFELAGGCDEQDLRAAALSFSDECKAFVVPRLKLTILGTFIALVPEARCIQADALGAACVRTFDAFRAPGTPEDLHRRRSKGLSPRQEELLEEWGYPYVMDEYRFHMTLTGPLGNAQEAADVQALLQDWLAPALCEDLPINAIALYAQPDRSAPFCLKTRLPFHR